MEPTDTKHDEVQALPEMEIHRILCRLDTHIKDMRQTRDALVGLLPRQKKSRKEFDREEFDKKIKKLMGERGTLRSGGTNWQRSK